MGYYIYLLGEKGAIISLLSSLDDACCRQWRKTDGLSDLFVPRMAFLLPWEVMYHRNGLQIRLNASTSHPGTQHGDT